MRRIGLLFVTALVGFLFGCETPSTTTAKVYPYIAASYNAGLDSSKGDFVVYISEGKMTGPSIQDATVTFDHQSVPWVPYGYYYLGSLSAATDGSEHTLRITHPTAFDPIEVKLVAPSGDPVAVTIANPPSDWNAALNSTTDISYTVSPVGEWPPLGTVVWANSYDVGYNVYRGTPYQPVGSSPVVCTFSSGTTYTGFSVRNQTQKAIPGATSDSLFRIEGNVQKRYGFDPTTLPPYRASLELAYDGAEWTASSYLHNTDYTAQYPLSSISIAGKTLKSESTNYPNDYYARWTGPALVDGSTIEYSFTDPGNVTVTGSAVWKSIELQVPASSPPKDAIGTATSLTFAAPSGGWPKGSRLFLRIERPDKNSLRTSRNGYGTSPIVFNEYTNYSFAAPNTVTIKGAIETLVPLPGYRGWLRLVGPGVSW